MLVRESDGKIHFSTLKRFALSPAHYKVACEEKGEPTRGMRLGTGVHFILLGARPGQIILHAPFKDRRAKGFVDWLHDQQVLCMGEGRGGAELAASVEILTDPEWEEATAIAEAVRKDPVAAKLLKDARTEVPLSWLSAGLPCATSGVDFIGRGYLGDLKTTTCTEPLKWQRHAASMLYHAQLAFYEEGAKENGIDVSQGLFIIGVEVKKPYAVTVLELTERTIEKGRRCVGLWLERLRGCEENDDFPAYVQAPVPFDLPDWDLEDEDLDEDDDSEEKVA